MNSIRLEFVIVIVALFIAFWGMWLWGKFKQSSIFAKIPKIIKDSILNYLLWIVIIFNVSYDTPQFTIPLYWKIIAWVVGGLFVSYDIYRFTKWLKYKKGKNNYGIK